MTSRLFYHKQTGAPVQIIARAQTKPTYQEVICYQELTKPYDHFVMEKRQFFAEYVKEFAGSDTDSKAANDLSVKVIDGNDASTDEKKAEYESYFANPKGFIDTEQLEETMQKIMDQYAGGISTNYEYNESRLEIAKRKIDDIEKLSVNLHADDMDDLLRIYELKERLVVCKVLIEHLKARKETRWHSFAENLDYPNKSDDYLKYVNSRYEDGRIKIIYRDLVTGGKVYEHSDK